ncbi:MAG: Arc family DNA-binding protein [Devosia sp.]|nr:Arc family DNA-binding protein [Devosia sp.]
MTLLAKGHAHTSRIVPFGLRMPPDVKAALEDAAEANGRSLNAEITRRLKASLGPSLEDRIGALEARMSKFEGRC